MIRYSKTLIKIVLVMVFFILPIGNINASIVGATKGVVDVSGGSLSYSLKIITPKGVAGLKPTLGIGYNSSNSVNSILGVGFSLNGLSTISKCYEDQKEYFCLDGGKLLLIDEAKEYGSENSEYRFEINNQNKVIKNSNGFTVYSKDGLISSYGNTEDSKDGTSFYRIDSIKDRFDNTINFKYTNTNNEKYIAQITYADNVIDFNYENKEDKETLYSNGIKVNFHQRLKNISIKTASTEVSSYKFTYTYIDNKSRINTITECSLGECLEPLQFNWQEKQSDTLLADKEELFANSDSTLKDWDIYTGDINNDSYPDLIQSYKGDKGHKFKVTLAKEDGSGFEDTTTKWFEDTNSALKDWEIYLKDINADGYADLIQSYKGTKGHKLKVSLSDGTKFKESEQWFENTNSALKDWEIYLQDINSDGLPDVIQSYKGTKGNKLKVTFAKDDRSGFEETAIELFSNTDSSLKDWQIFLNDINSDTLPDIIQLYKGSGGHKLKVSLNLGNNTFSNSLSWVNNTSSNLKDWEIYLQDMNADGLDDLIQSYKGSSGHKFKVSLNNGIGFETAQLWFEDNNSALKDYRIYAQDINNDGLPDLIQNYKGSKGHKLKVSLNIGLSFKQAVTYLDENSSSLKDWELYFGGINGDGFPDIIQSYKGSSGHKLKVRINTNKTLQIKNITNEKDENIDVEYSTLQDSEIYNSDSNSTYPKADIKKSSMILVKSLKADNGVGGQNETLFSYKNFKIDIKKGSLGFEQTTTITPVLNAKTVVEFHQEYPFIGVKKSSQSYLNGIKIQDETITLEQANYYTNQKILNLQTLQTQQNKYDIDGTYLLTQQTNNSNFDKFGNIGTIQQITTNNVETYEKLSTNTYTNDETKWILARLTDASVKHIHTDGSHLTKSSSFSYDINKGILISETIEPNNPKSISKYYTYDSYGNKTQEVIKANGETDRSSSFIYDSTHKNIIQVTNPLGFSEKSEYNITNQVVKHTDINGLVTTFTYDAMGKKKSQTNPDGTVTTWEHQWDNTLPNSLYSVTQSSTGIPPVTIYYNRFNKKLRTIKKSFDGRTIYEDIIYDEKGNVEKSTTPYYSGDPINYLYNTYDSMNRQIELKRFDKDGTEIITSFSYDGFNLITTNPKAMVKIVKNNILGKKIEVIEGDSAKENEYSTINYKYDAVGNLIETKDIKGNIITLKYDIFGNKIYQNDPDMGIWHYEYNPFGKLIKQTDAKGKITTIKYDILGRVLEKDENGTISEYKYDISPNAKGKLFLISNEDYKKEYYYDTLSRVSSVVEHIDGKKFTTKYIYDTNGKLAKTIHPNGFVLENEYNNMGYLSALKSPILRDAQFSNLKLKENIAIVLDKKINTFNIMIELNTQIERYRTKALQIIELAKKYKNVNSTSFEHLNKTAAYLIETSLKLRERAKKHEKEYEAYNKQLELYTTQVFNSKDEYLYKWLIEKYSSYTTDLISKALEQLNNALSILETIKTEALLEIYKDIITYRIQEAKTIIYEAKNTHERYTNYKSKYELLQEDNTYLAMFDNSGSKYYYKILKTDVFGRITKSFHGNGLVTNKTYDAMNGKLHKITTGYNGDNDIRDIEYSYDSLNNVTSKIDHKQEISQSYQYDSLDRIILANTVTKTDNTTITYQYNAIGNITSKSDVGEYTYHKVHQVATIGNNISYTYDANGNVTQKIKDGKTTNITYNAYNKPILLENENTTTRFYYNPDRSRYKKTQADTTTYYISKHYEEEISSTSILQKNFIYAGKELVAIHTETDDGKLVLPQNRYLHKDSLGSIDTITNESGVVVQRLAYNPFGKQILQSWINDNYSKKPIVKRGYTGHEHIKEFGFIHMNGRVYDPDSARFLSADPHIQAPYDTQSYNRYSYVKNNPLKYVDPSGFFFKKIRKAFKKIRKAFKRVWKKIKRVVIVVVAIVVAVYTGGAALAAMGYGSAATFSAAAATYSAVATAAAGGSFAAFGAIVVAGAVSGFAAAVVSTKLNGGSWSQSLKAGYKGAVIGAVSAGLAFGVAQGTASLFGIDSSVAHASSFLNGQGGYGAATFKAVAHGLSRVLVAKAQGNKTSAAFWSGFVSSAFSPGTKLGGKGFDGIAIRTVIAGVTAGTVSEISGGSFANGAVTGAFVHLFNAEGAFQRTVNKLVQGYYEAKGFFQKYTISGGGQAAIHLGPIGAHGHITINTDAQINLTVCGRVGAGAYVGAGGEIGISTPIHSSSGQNPSVLLGAGADVGLAFSGGGSVTYDQGNGTISAATAKGGAGVGISAGVDTCANCTIQF